MFDYEYWGLATLPARDNLALEEYFFRRPATTKKAVVRFFDFPRDSIILGYAQATDILKARDVEVARRLTGGSHVQVGENVLCYSFAVPRDGSFMNYEDMRAYYADIVSRSLEQLGLEASPDNKASTINIENRVVASHAIIWGVESALLHGLLVLSPYDIEKLAERVFLSTRKIGGNYYSELSAIKNIPALSELLQTHPQTLKTLVGQSILAQVTKGKPVNKLIGQSTMRQALEIQNRKYAGEAWNRDRSPPFTKEEVEVISGEELAGKLKTGLGYCFYSQVPDRDFKKMAESQEGK